VLFGKHIDKLPQDAAKKIYTMPVILGEKIARYAVVAMIAAMYLLVLALVITGYFSPVMLVVFVAVYTLPRVWAIYKNPKPAAPPADYPEGTWPLWFSATSFYHNRSYGMYLLVGLIISLFLH
jgi:1,4-dihydroxy-2-naphthoate octaprenyltransferase